MKKILALLFVGSILVAGGDEKTEKPGRAAISKEEVKKQANCELSAPQSCLSKDSKGRLICFWGTSFVLWLIIVIKLEQSFWRDHGMSSGTFYRMHK